jgi:hypothetical protein
MSQWEQVELKDATHVEMGGEVYEIGSGKVEPFVNFGCIDILVGMNDWAQIPQEAFQILGIRCLRKFKPKPIEFEAEFVSYDGNWRPLYSLDDGLAYQNFKLIKFHCVQIMEEE